MDDTTRKRLINNCKPEQALSPEDPRNLDIDALGSDEDKVRGVQWVDELARIIEFSDEPVCELFTGLPGSGKTTELLRLIGRLRKSDGAHLFPVWLDTEELIDLNNPIDVPDILLNVLYRAEQAVLVEKGKDPETALSHGFLGQFWESIKETQTTPVRVETGGGIEAGATAQAGLPLIGQAGVAVKASASAKWTFDIKNNPTLRERIRERVLENPGTFLKEVRDAISGLEKDVRALGYSGLLIVVDSLEKLSGLTSNWHKVLDSAERLFAGGAPKLCLPVHVIYTIPPALVLRLKVPVHFMPMIKIRDRDGKEYQPGIDAARELVRKRIPDDLLGEVLSEEQVGHLVRWSGGYPRELMRLLQAVLRKRTMSEIVFRRVLTEVGDEVRRTVPRDATGFLARVAVDRPISVVDDDDHRVMVDMLLSNNAVLRYRNADEWFDVHPAVLDLPEVAAARARLLAERAPAGSPPPVADGG